MTLHNVLGAGDPGGSVAFTAVADIVTATSFFVSDATLDRCVGARIYVPPAAVGSLPGTITLSIFPTIAGLDLGGVPARTATVATPAGGGWAEVTWSTPVDLTPDVPFAIASTITGGFLGGYLPTTAIPASDGSSLVMSASGAQRAWYKVGGGATTVSTDPGRWYATDAIVSTPEAGGGGDPAPEPVPAAQSPGAPGGIPLATTTITVRRPTAAEQSADPYGDGYEDAPGTPSVIDGQGDVVAAAVRAVISPGGARGTSNGSESELVEFRLVCDSTDLRYGDTVTDETTGQVFEVTWSVTTPGIAGLGHTAAGITTTKGQGQ